ncbi:hypothetical protein MBLNU457_4657t1 [Dothideomycetes sp. NU457]
MANTHHHSRRSQTAVLSRSGLPHDWEAELTSQFRRLLSTHRMNKLNRIASSRKASPAPRILYQPDSTSPSSRPSYGYDAQSHPQPPSRPAPGTPAQAQPQSTPSQPPPPPYKSLKNIPLLPIPPSTSDRQAQRFRSMLIHLSNTPCKWENPGLLDEALGFVPLAKIYDEAQMEADTYAAEAASLGRNTTARWGYQDCVIMALMRWFKRDFFKWVNNPKCTKCNSPTIALGMAAPLPDETARGAPRVELYQCSHAQCGAYERFPRYSDAFVLLQERRGRIGEWANCFGMLCRAIGSRVRWVWNSEDHVWVEVYSVHRRRWVHVDVCEGTWDQPLLYTSGWKKKLGYCVAFSSDGAMDVTRRYVRNFAKQALPRTKAPEAVLIHILNEIRGMRRKDLDKKEKFRLEGEDMREDREFRQLIIETLARDIARAWPGASRVDPDAQKAAEQRADAEWARARTEAEQAARRSNHSR